MRDPVRHYYGSGPRRLYSVSASLFVLASCLQHRKERLHIFCPVVDLVVDLRIGERPVAAKGLQRPFGDIQQLADLLVVQPRLRLADTMRMAERVHPSGELLESRKHPLEGSGFYIDYSHGSVVLRSRERAWIRLRHQTVISSSKVAKWCSSTRSR